MNLKNQTVLLRCTWRLAVCRPVVAATMVWSLVAGVPLGVHGQAPAAVVTAVAAKGASPSVASRAAAKAAPATEVRLSAAARHFFSQGLSFADQGDWEHAADRFSRAHQIRSSAVIAYNLALSLAQLGRVVEASELLHAIEADPDADPTLLASAKSSAAQVERQLATLAIQAGPGVGGQLGVFLDDVRLSAVELGAPVPVDPVVHEVTLRRGRQVVRRYSVTVAAGDHADLTVDLPANLARLMAAERLRAQSDARARVADSPDVTETWWFWTGVGAVAVSVVAVVTVTALSGSPKRLQGPVTP